LLAFLTLALAATPILLVSQQPRSSATREFDVDQARSALDRLIPRDVPHPVGSTEHGMVRDRLLEELRRLGYRPEVQQSFVCNATGTCSRIENIVAAPPAQSVKGVVLLAAHYDSVGASSGGCDDGAGVAVLLEAARVLRNERLAQPVAFLFTDAEELGLLGAEAFAAEHPLAAKVSGVINVDNRGCSGPSLLYEVAGDEIATMRALRLSEPHTSSFFREIYKHLPNDTDFTVFRRHGMTGINLAIIGEAGLYHSAGDAPRNLSRASLQQHGRNAVAAVRALSTIGKTADRTGVFFDLFNTTIVAWPVGWNWAFLAMTLLLCGSAVVAARREEDPLQLIVSLATPIGAALLAALLLFLAGRLMQGASVWIAHPLPFLWATVLFGFGAAALLTRKSDSLASTLAGQSLFWSLLTLAAAFLSPGFFYVPLFPAVATAVGALVAASHREWAILLAIILISVSLVATVVPLAALLYPGLGVVAFPVVAALSALIAGAFAPHLALSFRWRWITALSLFLIASAAFAFGLRQPALSPRAPSTLSVMNFRDESSALLAVTSTALPTPLRAAEWPRTPLFPTSTSKGLFARKIDAVDRVDFPQVTVEGPQTSGSLRTYRLAVRAAAGASRVSVALKDDDQLQSITVDGIPVTFAARFRRALAPGWSRLRIAGRDHFIVELQVKGGGEVSGYVDQLSFGAGAVGEEVRRLRSATLVPADDGDVTIARRHFKLR
jgi:hypothetical protein